ncbi:MAG: aminoacyl-histidine dipeptidase [Pseudomonadota bacterium]
MEIKHEKTKEVLKWFEEIAKIPRCSKKETQICNWLMNWAKQNNFEAKKDKLGNIVIKVPATSGYEKSKPVVLQGHVDMVCEKTPDSNHDFDKDPIKFIYEGEWLRADKTTLGADNGIAIAMAQALALSKDVAHPPLELLFTVDEETGLTGATGLEPGFIDGKILLNLDSEDEGYLTVGCAGGVNTAISLGLDFENIPANMNFFTIKASGMKGGHSGVDINKQKANAIVVLARSLRELASKANFQLSDFKGGTAHNAIPRDAQATICMSGDDYDKICTELKNFEKILKAEFRTIDPDLTLIMTEEKKSTERVLTKNATAKVINLLLALPHGVAAMSTDIANLVETSSNLANVKIDNGHLKIISSQRSSRASRLNAHTAKIEAVAGLCGAEAKTGDGYPAWAPNMNSPLLKKCAQTYENLFKKKPVIDVIHAGLECGIIGSKYKGMDMISFGPTIKFPHSPDEKIHLGTVGQVWDFLVEVLKELK